MNHVKKQMKRMKNRGYDEIELCKIREAARKAAQKQLQDAEEKAFLRMLAIPLNVLVSDYWKKAGKNKMKKYIEEVASLYESVQLQTVTDQQLADFLFEMTGIKIEADWMKE